MIHADLGPELEAVVLNLIENGTYSSRAQVLRLDSFTPDELELMAQRAEAAVGETLPLDDDARTALYELADGDGHGSGGHGSIIPRAGGQWRHWPAARHRSRRRRSP